MVDNSKKLKASAIPDSELLSTEDLVALREEARSKVLDDRKKDARKKALSAMIREENERLDPSDEIVSYTIDLPGYAMDIRLDGVQYVQGQTYKFSTRKLASVMDLIHNAWKHEAAIGGAHREVYKPPSSKAGPARYSLSAGFVSA